MPAAAGMQFVNGKFKFKFFFLNSKPLLNFICNHLQPAKCIHIYFAYKDIICYSKTEIRSIEFAFETSTCVSLAYVAPMPARQCPCSNLRMDLQDFWTILQTEVQFWFKFKINVLIQILTLYLYYSKFRFRQHRLFCRKKSQYFIIWRFSLFLFVRFQNLKWKIGS